MKQQKPIQVRIAVALFYVGLALSLGGFAIDAVSGGFGRPPVMLVVVYGLVAVATIMLIEYIAIGRNWARIVYLVLTLAGIALGLPALRALMEAGKFGGVATFCGQVATQGVGLALVFFGEGGRWFARRS